MSGGRDARFRAAERVEAPMTCARLVPERKVFFAFFGLMAVLGGFILAIFALGKGSGARWTASTLLSLINLTRSSTFAGSLFLHFNGFLL